MPFPQDENRPSEARPPMEKGAWHQRLLRRFRTATKLKFWASMTILVGFFIGYFLLLKFPLYRPTVMPVTVVDGWIPFQPKTLWLYISLWAYVQFPPALQLTRKAVLSYGKAVLALSGTGFFIFLVWPTKLAVAAVEVTQHTGFRALKEVDASGNACPSLHVAFAVFSGLALNRILREVNAPKWVRVGSLFWAVGICYSTLSTRQHVFLDVVAGALLAAIVYAVYLRSQRATPVP
jgi:membrane-associated phospholipid phosphatase